MLNIRLPDAPAQYDKMNEQQTRTRLMQAFGEMETVPLTVPLLVVGMDPSGPEDTTYLLRVGGPVLIGDGVNTVGLSANSDHTYGTLSVTGSKTGYAGVIIESGKDQPTFLASTGARIAGIYCQNDNYWMLRVAENTFPNDWELHLGPGIMCRSVNGLYHRFSSPDEETFFYLGGSGDPSAYVDVSGSVYIRNLSSVTKWAFSAATTPTLQASGVQVLTTRRTGWGAPTGTATRSTFATGSVTLPQLAERVKALIDDLTTHGMIGA